MKCSGLCKIMAYGRNLTPLNCGVILSKLFAAPLNQHYWSLGRSLAGLWEHQQIIPMHVYEVAPKKVGALKNWHPWMATIDGYSLY